MRIFVAMSEKAPNQASSKEDLEQLSALEKSMASFGMGDLDSEHGVTLKDWSAQDFANIYVRFRPHLISHARKFLREETQAEEVVQDAFLYLMTALPELDSELGVLRFLKWKTKMLCLDIIRSSQAGLNNNMVPLPDDVADETQPLDSLERADDAAIIRLALAKLNPRHREALIATMYEEKSHEEVAQQMGVGENAFRQLLFRARSSFRKALVGEAVVEGKSVSEIISIAARKNAKASAGLLGGGGALILLVALFLSPVAPSPVQSDIASSPLATEAAPFVDVETSPQSEQREQIDAGSLDSSSDQSGASLPTGQPDVSGAEVNVREAIELVDSPVSRADSAEDKSELTALRASFARTLDSGFAQELAMNSEEVQKEFRVEQQTIVIDSGPDLTAYIAFDIATAEIVQHVSLIYRSELGDLTAVPNNSAVTVERDDSGTYKVTYVATDFIFGDLGGAFGNVSVEDAPIRRSAIMVSLVVGGKDQAVDATFSLLPRS